jgi:tRNA-uridine aminocarboxypropyltransferase
MQIILLTHSREVSKKTNTGQLVQQRIPATRTIIWQRTQPDETLLQLINTGNTALVYPVEDTSQSAVISNFENYILIDSTWQEARKIFNRSPYLQTLPRIQLASKQVSQYSLRRNQVQGGLCTAECAVEILKGRESFKIAQELNELFHEFIK